MTVLFGDRAGDLRAFFESRSLEPDMGADWNLLPRVFAGGCTARPKVALVFINPTYRNQSAKEGWSSERAPFIGLNRIWRFLVSSGLLPASVADDLPAEGHWSQEDAHELYRVVAEARLYVTNLVKACRTDSRMPSTREARGWLPLLLRELNTVQPDVTVGMGALVSSLLAQRPIRVRDYAVQMAGNGQVASVVVAGSDLRIVPCYFPVGRGNPQGAREILQLVAAASNAHRVTDGPR